MGLQTVIDEDIKKAMLSKNKEELIAIRGIKSAILLARTEKGVDKELTPEQDMQILIKMAKQRKDSAELYAREKRQDLADKELFELEVINRYLPKQMDIEELTAEISKIIETSGATSMKDMGKVMGVANKNFAGKADGKTIAEIVKKLLS